MFENFPKLAKIFKPKVQEKLRISSRKNAKKTTPKCIRVMLLKTKDKEKNLKIS